MDATPRSFELTIGYTDKQGTIHKKITLSRRLTGSRLFSSDDDPQSDIPTQREALIIRNAITEFGTLSMPVTINTLLDLDSIDRDDLTAEHDKFLQEGTGGRFPEFLADNKVKLIFGYEKDGQRYDLIEFGARYTGRDEVDADMLGYDGLRRLCFLIGKQVTKSSTADGASVIDGALPIEVFDDLDSADIFALQVAAERWRQSFRSKSRTVQEEVGAESASVGGADGLES